MRKKSETAEENQEFLKKYDDSEYVKPSVTTDIVVFGMFDMEENNYRKNSDKILKTAPVFGVDLRILPV